MSPPRPSFRSPPPRQQPPRRSGGRRRRGSSGGSRLNRFLRWLFKAGLLTAIWGGLLLAIVVAFYAYDMPDIRQVTQPQRKPSITILTDDGTVLVRYGELYGKHVRASDVPKHLINAILAIEDRRFYSHIGIDFIGMLRASIENAMAGHVVQGGSTLTQQLAKNLFLTPDRTFRRKVQEILLALQLERTYTKDQILSAYLNRVYFGAGAYGVDAAAEAYFSKPVSALTLRESAMLAGLLRAPSRYSPLRDPAAAMERAQTVLAAMEEEEYITEEEMKSAQENVPVPRRKPGTTGDGRYFADWITDQVSGLLANAPQDIVISTTLDLSLQRAAERRLDDALIKDAKSDVSQGAIVTLSPDGAVRAMVGGRDYNESQFNRATQAKRQPGSAFKPVVYLAAIEQGLNPNDVFDDAPIKVGKWSPENYDGEYRGQVTARDALAHSINTVAVRIAQQVGISKVIETARALGITSPIGHDLSLALGTNTVSPLELTGAYATIAAGGRVVTPYAIKEIRNREGQVIYRRPEVNMPVNVNPQAVATLVDMMTSVISYGTGRRALLDRPVAGKTGTSSDYHDAWFLGFTADYVTGVWLGNDNNAPMKKITGGSLPAGVWHDYMMEICSRHPPRDLLQGLPSGMAPGENPIGGEEGLSDEGAADALGDLIKNLTGNQGI